MELTALKIARKLPSPRKAPRHAVRDAFVSSHQRLEGLKPPSADLLHRFVV